MLCSLFLGALALVFKVTIVAVPVLSAVILGLQYYVDNGFPLPLRYGMELRCVALQYIYVLFIVFTSIPFFLLPLPSGARVIRKVSGA